MAVTETMSAAIDAAVSPTAISMLWRSPRAGQRPLSASDVRHAFFSGPVTFTAVVQVPLKDGAVPVGLHFRIDGWTWMRDRVSITAGSFRW